MKKAIFTNNHNEKHFSKMNITICKSTLKITSNTSIITIIERDDGKKKQTLEN